jgi:transcriptional regulator with XRE-family HTH domain
MQDTFGVRLIKAQNRKAMRSSRLAAELDCDPSSIALMRMDKHSPSKDMLLRICKTLEVSADFLLGLSDEPRLK